LIFDNDAIFSSQVSASIESLDASRKDNSDQNSDNDPGNPTVNFRGERRSNQTHASTTDPDARLTRNGGKSSQLAYMGHLMTENRNGLIVSAILSQADGHSERAAALAMVEEVGG